MKVSLIVLIGFCGFASAAVIPLEDGNLEQILKDNEVVFVNFYADWCRFSQQLKPIFLEASEKFNNPGSTKVVWASVDADRQPGIATKYHVNKYPTLKLIRNGEVVKKEYRSQRSVEALTAYVAKQMDSGIISANSPEEIQQKIDTSKRTVIGIFSTVDNSVNENFKKVASVLREDCSFVTASGPAFAQQLPIGSVSRISFRSPTTATEEMFSGDASNYDEVKIWIGDRCIPLVREITFENAEELTEEGLPFLILFKHPDDKTSEKVFSEAVVREISDQKAAVNCLVADGKRFAHPLHHLGKSESDLPVIAIDSFRHMYLFPNTNDLGNPGKLRQFVLDLHSGKLHREFHHGPDPTQQVIGETQPPPSVFEKLKPSQTRYTILDKDEL